MGELGMPLKRKLQDRPTAARNLCFFGVGAQLLESFDQIASAAGRVPDYLCDNDAGKWGRVFQGIPCLSPAQLAALEGPCTVVITVKSVESVSRQLAELGIGDIRFCCFDRCYTSVRLIKKLLDPAAYPPSSPISIQGKWAFVTGAARGIGRRIAIEMAGLGANVVAHSRCTAHTEELAALCAAAGVQFLPVAAELSDPVALDSMLSRLELQVPGIDIVYNNAAISPPCPSSFWDATPQHYLDSYAVNTVAPIRICQRLIPPMLRRGFGRVINVTSSIQKRPAEMAYACSKAGLDKFVHDLAPLLSGTGVMMTLLDPGWLRTDMGGAAAPHPVESVVPGVLLGALLEGDINGRWFEAHEYAGLELLAALQKAKYYYISQEED